MRTGRGSEDNRPKRADLPEQTEACFDAVRFDDLTYFLLLWLALVQLVEAELLQLSTQQECEASWRRLEND